MGRGSLHHRRVHGTGEERLCAAPRLPTAARGALGKAFPSCSFFERCLFGDFTSPALCGEGFLDVFTILGTTQALLPSYETQCGTRQPEK